MVPDTMTLANVALYVIGGAIALVGLATWRSSGCRDPFLNAPARGNRFGFEAVGLAMLVYVLGAALCLSLVDALDEPAGQTTHLRSDDGSITSPTMGDELAEVDAPPAPPPIDPARLLAGSAAQVIGLAACLLLAGMLFDGGVWRFLFGPCRWVEIGAKGLMLAIVALPLCDLALWSTTELFNAVGLHDLTREHGVIQLLMEGDHAGWIIGALWLGAVVVAPLAEEAFFRGILQTAIATLSGRRRFAVICSALLFGASHYGGQPQAIPALILLGLLLGGSYERTGSLLVPMLLHSLFNLKTMIWVTWSS